MRRTHRKPRQGALMICVLVCLLVASAVITTTTHSALRSRRDVQSQHQMRQTELLLDAGVLRAARLLRTSDDYQGESWRPTAAISRFDNALVEIRVTAHEDGSRGVEVVASLGVTVDDVRKTGVSLTRRSHTFSLELSGSSPTSDSPKSAE